MNRTEAYAEGFQRGRRDAEEDIAAHVRYEVEAWPITDEIERANVLGECRGYRDTWARWDAGMLTASMLEHAPLRAGR